MTKTAKKPHEELSIVQVVLLALSTVFILSCACIGFAALGEKGNELWEKYHPAPPSPGELVDRAMAMPGAIVISPHRDLVEMGVLAVEKANPPDCRPVRYYVASSPRAR